VREKKTTIMAGKDKVKKKRGLRTSELLDRRIFLQSLNTLPMQKKMYVLKHLDEKSIRFLAECFRNIVDGESSLMRLSKPQQALAQKHWEPYMPTLRKISLNKLPNVVKQVKRQTGDGLLMAALISAAMPIISSLIESLSKKKRKK
jgi:hypothetical protein